MKSIATINFKGGVGKTTVTWLLAKFVAEKMNKKVLVVDADAQMSLTTAVQMEEDKGTLNKEFNQWYNQHLSNKKTIYNLLDSYQKSKNGSFEFSINSALIFKMSENLHFIPSVDDMYWFESDLTDTNKVKDFMKVFLSKLEHSTNFNYDYVFFDCPAYFTSLTYSIVSASDMILLPTNPDVFALRGITDMIAGLVQRMQPWHNPKIGVIMNKVKTYRENYITNESKMYLNEVRQIKQIMQPRGISIEVFDSCIPEYVDIKKTMPKTTFPAEYEECFHNIWTRLNKKLEG